METEEQRESRYLGSQLQMNCGVLTPIVEYCIGANSYRQRQAVQRRSQSDIIMDFVVMNPNKALRFLRSAIICGILMNACVYLTENFLCAYAYPRKITLNRDIWWWLMVNKILQVLQVPLRVFFLFILRKLQGRSIQEIMYCMSILTTCRMWHWTKYLSVANYIWYGIGFVFTSKPNTNNDEWLGTMAAYVLCIIGFRIMFTIILIYYVFPPEARRHTSKPQPKIDLKTIPVHLYKDVDLKSTMCGICLDEFVPHDNIRVLGCLHGFHVTCIDAWLFRSASCPFCLSKVD